MSSPSKKPAPQSHMASSTGMMLRPNEVREYSVLGGLSVIVSLIEMVTISENGILGCIMNIVSSCSFACTAAVIYKKKRTLKGAVTGLLAGSVAMVLVMMLWNYLIAPIYMGYPGEAVAKLLIPAFLPFNLLKSGLNAGFTFL